MHALHKIIQIEVQLFLLQNNQSYMLQGSLFVNLLEICMFVIIVNQMQGWLCLQQKVYTCTQDDHWKAQYISTYQIHLPVHSSRQMPKCSRHWQKLDKHWLLQQTPITQRKCWTQGHHCQQLYTAPYLEYCYIACISAQVKKVCIS